MTEEIKQVEVKEEVKTEVKEETQKKADYTESETRAMAHGWKPKDEWEGDPEEWVSARQFIKNGELFERINSYKHKIIGLEKSVNTLVKHNENIYETGYKDAVDNLKSERRLAMQEGDLDKVEKIEEKMEGLRETHIKETQSRTEALQQAKAPEMHPGFTNWVEKNTWYGRNSGMTGYADGVAKEIISEAKNEGVEVDYEHLLTEVTRKTRLRFPETFQSSGNKKITTKDDGASGGGRGSNKERLSDVEQGMDAGEREMMDVIIRSGVSKEKYLKDYQQASNRKGRG